MSTLELFPKQDRFFRAENRINIYVGGIQSGKTTGGGGKMTTKGILTFRDPSDNFIIAADTYKTLSQATVPKFLALAKGLGKLNRVAGEFKTIWGSTVYLRTATEPESMEGITNVRRIWIDEAGKISRYFFENAMGRAAFKEAPIDITTTPYAMNWLADLCKDAQSGKRSDVSFTHCRSIDSPYFPVAEYERQKKLLDPRRFAMKYDGVFGKMEGLVYDHINTCKSFALPSGTKFYAGIDWGYAPDPFCLVVRAVTPDGRHYRVAEYYRNYLIISDVIDVIRSFHGIYKFEMCYCDPSRPSEIAAVSLHVPACGAENDIRLGIDKHYELIKTERFHIFEDMNPLGIDEYSQYHYPESKELEVDQGLRDSMRTPVDKDNHGCDADRYISVELAKMHTEKRTPKTPSVGGERPRDLAKKIEWLKKGGMKNGL
jgi:hypothetical protein